MNEQSKEGGREGGRKESVKWVVGVLCYYKN